MAPPAANILGMDSTRIAVGAVAFEAAGDAIVISSTKHPEVQVEIPARALEAWGLRKLREEALQPAAKEAQ
jgi:hypothetical protein